MALKRKSKQFKWHRKHLLGLRELSAEEITYILDTAKGFEQISTRSVKKAPPLRGKVVVNLFFEDSTRTRNSFALAANRLSADIIEFTKKASSVSKGETLLDTARNLEAMGIDIVVIRHSAGGAPKFLSRNISACVVNAGDGFCEHPTQGLLDVYTIRKIKRTLEGLKIAIVGDVAHSRVARSDMWAMTKLGAEVINADSRQVYKGMDLGTGKDYSDYLVDGQHIPYHLIDIVEPGTEYNVYQYQKDFYNALTFGTW